MRRASFLHCPLGVGGGGNGTCGGARGVDCRWTTLPSASYSTHAVRGSGGFVVGTRWQQLLTIGQAQPGDDVRADVYWELPSGELVLTVRNASGFGPGGRGYLLLQPQRAP